MKKLIYISLVSLLLLSSCHPRPWIKWKDMPDYLFSSYFPYQEGDTILFCSDDLDTLSYICKENYYSASHDCQTGGYVIGNSVELNEISKKSLCYIYLLSDVRVAPPYKLEKTPKYGRASIECGNDDIYYNLNLNLDHLTLYQIYTKDYDVESEGHNIRFYLKKNMGIVWFEYEGVRYTRIK